MYSYFMSKLEFYCDMMPKNAESCNPGTVTEASAATQWPVVTCFHGYEDVPNSWRRHFRISPQPINTKQYSKSDTLGTASVIKALNLVYL